MMSLAGLSEKCCAILNDGGHTFSTHLSSPISGFMVSIAGSERTVPVELFGPETLREYVDDYADQVARRDLYYGAWVDGGLVYLDLSMNVLDLTEAEAAGRMESQLAIFDVANEAVISL